MDNIQAALRDRLDLMLLDDTMVIVRKDARFEEVVCFRSIVCRGYDVCRRQLVQRGMISWNELEELNFEHYSFTYIKAHRRR